MLFSSWMLLLLLLLTYVLLVLFISSLFHDCLFLQLHFYFNCLFWITFCSCLLNNCIIKLNERHRYSSATLVISSIVNGSIKESWITPTFPAILLFTVYFILSDELITGCAQIRTGPSNLGYCCVGNPITSMSIGIDCFIYVIIY